MAQIMVKVRNLRTSREYLVSEKGWEDIVKQGWENRYTVLDRRQLVESTTPSYIPAEIVQAAESAAKALELGERVESKTTGRSTEQTIKG